MNTNSIDLNHRQFTSPGQGFWPDATPEQWNSWQWQMQHSVKSLEALKGKIELTREEHAGVLLANTKLAMGITPYFFNLIDPFDLECPIRRQVIPRIEEMTYAPTDMADPCGEDHDMPVPGLVHRYPDRVLFLVTDRCASSAASANRNSSSISTAPSTTCKSTPKSATSSFPAATRSCFPIRASKIFSADCAPSSTSNFSASAAGSPSSCRSGSRPNSAPCSRNSTRSGSASTSTTPGN